MDAYVWTTDIYYNSYTEDGETEVGELDVSVLVDEHVLIDIDE